MTIVKCPLRARAWHDDALVAESDACLSLERDGAPSVLWFPVADIDADRLVGSARDLLTILVDPPEGLERLEGHGSFDQEQVRVELIDEIAGDDPRPATIKRFPTWGDAAHLIDMLDVRREGDHRFVAVTRSDGRRPVVEGSQMLGQAIVAGCRLVPDRRVMSAHMAFLRGADAGRTLDFEFAERSNGRTFTSLLVDVLQDGRYVATGSLLLGTVAPDVVRHAAAPPDVAGPFESEPCDMAVTGRDIRVVDGAYSNDSDAPIGPPVIDAWVRFREVPDDPALHAGLLAQFTGHMSIAAAMRPHAGVGQDQAHRTLSTGINAIDLTFHDDVRADRWMLYHHLSTFAGGGMTHSECRVHDEAGTLLASFTVEAMVRPFPAGTGAVDERTAL